MFALPWMRSDGSRTKPNSVRATNAFPSATKNTARGYVAAVAVKTSPYSGGPKTLSLRNREKAREWQRTIQHSQNRLHDAHRAVKFARLDRASVLDYFSGVELHR